MEKVIEEINISITDSENSNSNCINNNSDF